jgi:hypothetical protein
MQNDSSLHYIQLWYYLSEENPDLFNTMKGGFAHGVFNLLELEIGCETIFLRQKKKITVQSFPCFFAWVSLLITKSEYQKMHMRHTSSVLSLPESNKLLQASKQMLQ